MYNEGLLKSIVKTITVSTSRYEAAENRYLSLSNWFGRADSKLNTYEPLVYPHGSFSMGTAINPISGEKYDLDIMCCLTKCSTKDITEYNLKRLVGNEIVQYANSYGMEKPEDHTRAWTINYSEKSQFQMDIIPSIPYYNGTSVFITYKENDLYNQIHDPWEKVSNPQGYLEWFKEKCKENLLERRKRFADARNISIEKVPKYEIKSVLQEVVMLLKRHRDVFFDNMEPCIEKDKKVSSIIITTLAANIYRKQNDVSTAFIDIVENFEDGIQIKNNALFENFKYSKDFIIGNKDFRIVNPSNPEEDFTDKWPQDPYKKTAFFKWLDALKEDTYILKNLLLGNNSKLEILTKMFGKDIISNISDYLVDDIKNHEEKYIVKLNKNLSIIGQVSIKGFVSNRDISELQNVDLVKYKFISNEPIGKEKKLLFIAESNIREPYQVWWQVSNKEKESIDNDDIRGEFKVTNKFTKGYLSRYQTQEHSKYKGTHWIRCFIIKDGYCCAQSGKFYVKVE